MKIKESVSNVVDLTLTTVIESNPEETTLRSPLKEEVCVLTEEQKIAAISKHVKAIMDILGLDLNDKSLKDTPSRVAQMYVKEIFSGLNPKNSPQVTLFENKYHYHGMLVEKNIKVHSFCEHHLIPIIGKAHIAYIPKDYVIGLSKISQIVHYYAKRPQLQERLTIQIAQALKKVLKTEDVGVIIDAEHTCVSIRDVEDTCSSTITSSLHGKLKEKSTKEEFLNLLKISS
ncbi:MAG: GTP cyclohydrolase I FolE [Cytophagales bacterium]|nr:GTP cyclohydrolase I FolE [Cytophagales bacterium]